MINEASTFLIGDKEICTPYYCFNTDIFSDRIRILKEKLDGNARLCYSLKANPWLVKAAMNDCDLIEVCSSGELSICKEFGIPMEYISVGGVSKTEEECNALAKAPPYRISVESPIQLAMLEHYAAEHGKQLSVILRLTSGNQFGMPLEVIRDVFNNVAEYPHLMLKGIHYYPGTQNKNLKNAENLLHMLRDAADSLPINELQFGAGFGAALYTEQDNAEFNAYVDLIAEGVAKLAQNYDIVFECGRYLAYTSGAYITTILDIKEQCGRCFLIVDGGIHQLSYYGQINGKPVPIIKKIPYGESSDKQCCTVCGSLCTANDILAKDVVLHEPQIGDKLIFMNVGAYSVTEARSLFLSGELPAVVLKDSEETIIVRKMIPTYKFNTW